MKTYLIMALLVLLVAIPSVGSQEEDWKEKLGDDLKETVEKNNVPAIFSLFVDEEPIKVIILTDDKEELKKTIVADSEFSIIPGVSAELTPDSIKTVAKIPSTTRILVDYPVRSFRLESLVLINAASATTNFAVNGTNINISVVDSGILNHTEFQSPNRIIKEKCFVSSGGKCPPSGAATSDNATDDNGHGTHVAGIAAGEGGSVFGAGVATNASLLSVKALNAAGEGTISDIVSAIEWSVDNGANIISLSLGTDYSQFTNCYNVGTSTAIDNATSLGVLVVVAVGNDGSSSQTIAAPGCAKSALSVGSVNESSALAGTLDNVSWFSSRGPTNDNRTKPDLVSPGAVITSTWNASQTAYKSVSGTSQATPHVSGVAALVMERYMTINGYLPSPHLTKTILMTAVNTTGMQIGGHTQRNNAYGAGRIDADTALSIVNFTRNSTITQNETKVYYINITNTTAKLTLYWPENSSVSNNLDLVFGNASLNYSYSTDSRDNVEQVFIYNATNSTWKVYVNGTTVSGSQDFYLASDQQFIDFITVESPLNQSYSTASLHFNMTVTKVISNAVVSIDNINHTLANDTTMHYYNLTIPIISESSHNATFYTNDSNTFIINTTYFTVDLTKPLIYIQLPENGTYNITSIDLNFTISEAGSWCGYSLDNAANATLSGCANSTVSSLSEGPRNITIYANDTAGNMNASAARFFTVSTAPTFNNSKITSAFYNESVQLNSSWYDNSLQTVLLESNFSDTLTNYTVTANSSNEFYFTIERENQTVNRFIVYKWYANDTTGHSNSSAQSNYTVIKASTLTRLFLNGTEGNRTYEKGSMINFTATLNITGKNVTILANFTNNTVTVSNGTTPQQNATNSSNLNITVYNITAYFVDDENHTGSSVSYNMTVLRINGDSCSAASECFGGFCNSGVCASSAPPTPTPTPSSSGGGGGGGVIVAKQSTKVTVTDEIQAKITIPSITANMIEDILINDTYIVQKISIKPTVTVNNVEIKIQRSAPPTDISHPTGKVFEYLKVDETNITHNQTEAVNITFKVGKTWVSENNINTSTIVFVRYTSQWDELITILINETEADFIYIATSPGLSIFAIKGDAIELEPEEPAIPETITQDVSQQTEEKVGNKVTLMLALIIMTVVAFGVVIYIIVRHYEDWLELYEKYSR